MKFLFMKNSKLILNILFLCISSLPLVILKAELKEQFSKQDRNQLLKMATFGPTAQMVLDVNLTDSNQEIADEIEWLDNQLAHPSAYDDPEDEWLTHFQRVEQIATTLEPTVDYYQDYPDEERKSKADGYRIFNRFAPGTSSYNLDAFQMSAWWDNVLGNKDLNSRVGSDQLRQRMAYALSQLLVVSKVAFPLNGRTEGLAWYYDLLAENAFGNYEMLLRKVLRSPAMGVFLSSAMNQKASLAKNTRPDENLAREFLQLFTIGPYMLELDGSRKIGQNGKSIPSYSQNDIIEMAKVLTGWNLFLLSNWNRLGKNSGSYQHFMAFHPSRHEDEKDDFYADDLDPGEITLFEDTSLEVSLELNASDVIKDGAGNSTNSGLDAAISVVFNHPNVGPFVSRHLIKHFVTSNPTPGYVSRVASVFNDDGNGERGNLKAVLKAILLDKEAYNQSIEVGGRVKEPLLVLTQLLRAMEAKPWPKTRSIMLLDESNPKYLQKMYSFRFPESTMNQAALRAFDVFNFYDRDFIPPDDDVMTLGLTSQESEIINDNFFPNFQNEINKVIKNYKDFRLKCKDPIAMTGLDEAPEMNYYWPNFAITLEKPLSSLIKGLGRESGLLDDVNNSDFEDLEVVSSAISDLIDWYEENLLFAPLDPNFRSAFIDLCTYGLNRVYLAKAKLGDQGHTRALEIVENSLLLLVSSPEFMVEAGTVPDLTPPKIELLGQSDISMEVGETYVESGYKATDNVFGDMQSKVTITGDVNTSKAGKYEIVYSVVDVAGNVSEIVKRTITVSEIPVAPDEEVPVLQLIGPDIVSIAKNEAYLELGFTVWDNVDQDLESRVIVRGEVNASRVGTYILEYSVFDLAGNTSEIVTRSVVVKEPIIIRDLEGPSLVLKGSSRINLHVGQEYKEPGYSANDTVDGNLTSSVIIQGFLSTSRAGTYKLSYYVADSSGNFSEIMNRIVVVSESLTPKDSNPWWSDADLVGNGFYQSWLGYFMPFDSGWIYHTDLGWVYVVRNDTVGLWLWTHVNGWIWVSEESWPFLWSNQTGHWLYLIVIQGQPYFFDYSRNAFLK